MVVFVVVFVVVSDAVVQQGVHVNILEDDQQLLAMEGSAKKSIS